MAAGPRKARSIEFSCYEATLLALAIAGSIATITATAAQP
jgi:hypothetical protein